jgi:hypothetical protein
VGTRAIIGDRVITQYAAGKTSRTTLRLLCAPCNLSSYWLLLPLTCDIVERRHVLCHCAEPRDGLRYTLQTLPRSFKPLHWLVGNWNTAVWCLTWTVTRLGEMRAPPLLLFPGDETVGAWACLYFAELRKACTVLVWILGAQGITITKSVSMFNDGGPVGDKMYK